MKALDSIVGRIRAQNREIAEVLCVAVDSFGRDPRPDRLQILLDVLRDGQMTCEEESKRLRAIDARRKRHYARLRRRDHEFGRAIGAQYTLVAERARLVEIRRRLLRQIGDAVAWVLLGGNVRLIASLYTVQTHQIPREAGLAGAILVEHALHESGKYFVLETDLVRCVGTGDLLVIPVERIAWEPLVLELKSSGEVKLGAELGVGIGSAYANDSAHQEIFDDVAAILKTSEWISGGDSPRTQRQIHELGERTKRMFQLNRSGAQVLRRPSSPHWRAMTNIIDRAIASGSSFDVVEAGVYKWAVRNRPGDDLEGAIVGVHRRIHSIAGISDENKYAWSATADLAERDDLSTVVLPVALWDLPAAQRAAILADELVVGNLRQVGLLEGHLRALGVALERVDGGVRLRKDGDERVMSQLEFTHVEASTSMTGLSLRDVATVLAEGFQLDPDSRVGR